MSSKRPSSPYKRLPYSQPTLLGQFIQLVVLVCCVTWLVAVIKVFLFEDWKLTNELNSLIDKDYDRLRLEAGSLADVTTNSKIHMLVHRPYKHSGQDTEKITDREPNIDIENGIRKSYEFKYINSPSRGLSIDNRQKSSSESERSPTIMTNSVIAPITSQKMMEWPPLTQNGSIIADEGYDVMPLTGMKVPKFWVAPPNADINTIGTKVNGHETIFLMIASYRDFQCRETIASAFNRADHPERLFVGAVDQVVPGDIGCLDLDVPCSVDPNQPACKYRSQISVYKMDAQYATGPVTARHIGDRLYRGQYFVMQMDAHCHFVRHWDSYIIDQWRSTKNEMAVLSSYLTDYQGSLDKNFDSTRDTRPIMCNSDFEGNMPARYLRHGAQPEEPPAIKEMPQLQPFWAAGFSFSRGHFKYRVPYDGYQPMVFQGEEIAIGIRGFTHGYDFYAPRDSVVFHEYADNSNRRSKIHMFWENGQKHIGEGQKSLRRATAIIGMAPDVDPKTWDHSEEERYGLGKVARKAVQLCPFVRSGKMHRNFQKYLRPDGLGIDFNKLTNFDTKAAMSGLSPYYQN